MKLPSRRVDKSHLDEHEKAHTFALAFLGVLLICTGVGAGFIFGILDIRTGVVSFFLMAGTWCIAFPWGYIGSLEEERSKQGERSQK